MMFSPEIIEAAKAHALREYPNESCGVILGDEYVECENISPTPKIAFAIARERELEFFSSGLLRGLIHSHTNGVPHPGKSDMEGQIASNIPWGILNTNGQQARDPWFWGTGVPIPPLEGRGFRHGPSGTDNRGDCYALIRDWYRLNRNITLIEFPRDYPWWDRNENMYAENFAKAGFESLDMTQAPKFFLTPPVLGDVFLVRTTKRFPTHGAIYLGNELFLHHYEGQLSISAPLNKWKERITHHLRYPS